MLQVKGVRGEAVQGFGISGFCIQVGLGAGV